MLHLELEHVEENRQRRQGRTPPGQPAMAQQRVDRDAHRDAHRRLEDGDRIHGVRRQQQQGKEERVAAGPDAVRDMGHRVAEVVERIVEPHDRRVTDDDNRPED